MVFQKVETFSFFEICGALSKIENMNNVKARKQVLTILWEKLGHFKQRGGRQNLYPLMRILLPHLDIRATYGMKEKKLAELYIKTLSLPKESRDANMLLKYKNPKYAAPCTGDFPSCLEHVMIPRSPRNTSNTVEDVNKLLQELQKCENFAQRMRICRRLVNDWTAQEQKWLVRMMLKDMKIGFRQESMLKEFHPAAPDVLHKSSSLEKVCKIAMKPWTGQSGVQITLFEAIKPMLASRRPDHQKLWKEVQDVKFGVEVKFDGERVQLHYERGNKFIMFSRKGLDLNQLYGYGRAFNDIINQHMQCESCILDGEMMAWDTVEKCYVPFGGNRAAAASDIQGSGNTHLCYLVFDCLMKDNFTVMDRNLLERRQVAASCFTEKKTHFEMVDLRTGFTKIDDILNYLDSVLGQRHEGIMIKKIDAKYIANKRDFRWMKLKPEYLDDFSQHLDVLILGGYFGEGSRRVGDLSTFLCGVADPDPNGGHPKEFFTFCKVGTGYSIDELQKLRNRLKPHLKPYDPHNPPPHLKGWSPPPDDVPDAWIAPENSVILEVKAGEICDCVPTKFLAKKTARFPRCSEIRYNKAWHECLTLDEMYRLAQDFQKSRKRKAIDILLEESPKKKRKVRAKKGGVQETFLPVNVADIKPTSKLFENKEFCVFNIYGEGAKRDIEIMLATHSARIVMNVTSQTDYVIADKMSFRVRNNVRFGNIMKSSWVRDCVKYGKMLEPTPQHMLHRTEETAALHAINFDRYGDSYINIDEPDQAWQAVDSMSIPEEFREVDSLQFLTPQERSELKLISGKAFSRVVAYIDRFDPISSEQRCGDSIGDLKLELVEADLLMYGAKIATKLDTGVTHIIVNFRGKPRPRMKQIDDKILELFPSRSNRRRPHLVTADWVGDCLKDLDHAPLEEKKYLPPPAS